MVTGLCNSAVLFNVAYAPGWLYQQCNFADTPCLETGQGMELVHAHNTGD